MPSKEDVTSLDVIEPKPQLPYVAICLPGPELLLAPDGELGSGLIDHSQKMTTAAMHMADMNV